MNFNPQDSFFEILIVDDDVDLAETIQEILEDEGHHCTLAHNSDQAAEALKNVPAQMALVDFRIGQDNGLEVIARLKKISPELMCIMMTAFAELDTAIGAIKAGAEDFLQKPMAPVILLAALERAGEKLRLKAEREEALQALEESESRFQFFMDNSPITAFMKTAEGEYVWANRRGVAQVKALTNKEPVGLRDEDIFNVETVKRQKKLEQRVLAENKTIESVEEVQMEDGLHYFLSYKFPFTGKDGTRYISGVALDITEQKRNEEEIKNQQELLAGVFEALPLWLSVKDRDFKYIMVNRKSLEDTGLTQEDYLRSNTASLPLGGEEEMGANLALDKLVLETGMPQVAEEHQHTLPNGEVHLYIHHKAPYLDAKGEIAGIVTASVDITEIKNAEKALRVSEGRFRNLAEGSLQGIVIHNNMRPVFVNATFASIFGAESADVIKEMESIAPLFSADSNDVINGKNSAATLEMEAGGAPLQLQGKSLSGESVLLEVFQQEVIWEDKPCIQLTLVDITRQRQLESQLRQSQKMEAVGQLAGGVAHDFNNMLQIIHGYAELAVNQIEKSKDPVPTIERIRQTAESAGNLARQLLAFSRREGLKHQPLKVNDLINNLMRMLHRVIGEDIELSFQGAEEVTSIKGDKGALEQVFLNLCVNARDAMPDGGSLRLSSEMFIPDAEFHAENSWAKAKAYVLLRVRDSGSGIPQETLGKVFEPFFTTKETGKGTGLGLSMAYGTLRQHDGMITVTSENGKGTEFSLYLPEKSDSEVSITEKEAPSPDKPVGGGNETILVAEDDESVLRLVVELLKSKGYQVFTASNGEEAVEVYKQEAEKIQLALVDVVMPKKSGRYVYEEIKRLNPKLPILFSTGYTGNVLDEKFVREENFTLIRKPYSPKDLFKIVRETLDDVSPS